MGFVTLHAGQHVEMLGPVSVIAQPRASTNLGSLAPLPSEAVLF